MTAPHYPETRRDDTAETLFGETIADPYRWLENDVRNDAEVAEWVERENAVTTPTWPGCRRAIGSGGGSASSTTTSGSRCR
jgi:protease II